jgi:hypothetical protein
MRVSPRGIALLIILWVATILTVIAFPFSVIESYGILITNDASYAFVEDKKAPYSRDEARVSSP